ncbi:MAG: endo-polygalacturonase, partial [Alistipes sp.]|nr:endo-polygalacturonase [Alistipes sp.]
MKRVVAYLLGLVLAPMWVQAGVVSHTMPAERYRSLDYVVEVNGVEVPVYRALSQHHDKKYSIAYFDMEGSVEVVVKSSFPLSNLQILPAAKAIEPQVSGEVARFRLQEPMDLSFEPDGCN